MSVLMVLRVSGTNAAAMRDAAAENPEFTGIAERAKGRGAIHHAFFEGDGEVVVVDEWESAEAFQSFFEDEAPNIGPLMQAAGGQPGEPAFYEKIALGDEF